MSRLNEDVLYLIFVELQDDRKTFYSCLSVNKTWCEIIIPILWKNPLKYLVRGKEKLLSNVFISHLSDKSRDSLSLGKNSLYQRPLFNYISFYRHLYIGPIIDIFGSEMPIIKEIFSLFFKNTKFTYLNIPYRIDEYQLHLISGAKHCFSELEFLHCTTGIKDSILDGLLGMCKSIRILVLDIEGHFSKISHGVVKLIETQKKLYDVRFITWDKFDKESFIKILEDSLIKHANTIQYFKTDKQPTTKILSSFKNLKRLEMHETFYKSWNCLENLSLPLLQILKADNVPIKVLVGLIQNTSGSLTEISIIDKINDNRIIQTIYQECPNLKYLKLYFYDSDLLGLEKILINCKDLNGLVIGLLGDDWDNLFKILTKSSPTDLFKFKIYSSILLDKKLKSLELFLDNWKGRHPMYLQIISKNEIDDFANNLIEKYKADGIIKKFDHGSDIYFEDFEWIQKKLRNSYNIYINAELLR